MIRNLFIHLFLICWVTATPVWAGEKPTAPPTEKDLEVIALMEILQLMDMAQEMEMVKEMEHLTEGNKNEQD